MFGILLVVHLVLCLALVALVLVQQGKGADMGAAFGAGGSNTLFGAAGAASGIVKFTTGVAVAFMITSVLLMNMSKSTAPSKGFVGDSSPLTGSVFDKVATEPAPESQPSTATDTTSVAKDASSSSPAAQNSDTKASEGVASIPSSGAESAPVNAPAQPEKAGDAK